MGTHKKWAPPVRHREAQGGVPHRSVGVHYCSRGLPKKGGAPAGGQDLQCFNQQGGAMRFSGIVSLVIFLPLLPAQTVTISGHGWTVTAEPGSRTISIEQSRFGTVAAGLRLGVREAGDFE